MKLIYAQGFSKTERLEWKPVVFNNIIQSFRLIFDAMQELDIEFQNKENEARATTHPPSVCSGASVRRVSGTGASSVTED